MTLTQLVQKIPRIKYAEDFRENAGIAAARTFGVQALQELPIFVNIAALTYALGESPIIYELKNDALELIDDTDLRSFPRETPSLLSSACIVENNTGVLFGETTDLGIYPMPDGRIGIIGLTGRDQGGGAFFTAWNPKWGEHDISEFGRFETDSDEETYKTWAQDAIRFLIVFSVMLEAEKRPIVITEAQKKQAKSVKIAERKKGRSGWRIKSISMTTQRKYPSHEKTEHEKADLEDKLSRQVYVSGHIAHQAYGPQWSQHRWIYKEGYEARRWIAPGPRKIIVKI